MTEYDGVERSTATETFRAMLDERGGFRVDFDRGGARRTCWKIDDEQDGYCYFDEDAFGATQLTVTRITPEQAIAATLGTGTCREVMINRHRRGCSECGYVWENMYGEGFQKGPNYCPMCGRRIVQ